MLYLDSISIDLLETQASACLQRVAESGHPLVIEEDGRPAGVLLSVQAFDELTEQTEHSRFLRALDEGLADSDAGRVHAHADVIATLKKRLGASVAR